MARKKSGKILSGGAIVLCVVLFCMTNVNAQIMAQKVTFTISGSTGGVGGVTLKGLKDTTGLDVISDASGFYSATVEYGWSATVVPQKQGYRFEPATKSYPAVTANITDDYSAIAITYTVSGKVTIDGAPMDGVQMTGLPGDPVTGANGAFTATVPWGWDGVIIPMKEGFEFKPSQIQDPPAKRDKTNANFLAEPKMILIAGSIGVEGVTLDGLPGNPKTDENGNYQVKVPYNWTGTATPKLEGYQFNPPDTFYPPLTDTQSNQNYQATILTFIIAGTTMIDGVEMKGLVDISGQPVISDTSGYYSATVKAGFSGTVEPTKPGYTFKPGSMMYTKVNSDKMDENYDGSLQQMTLSGRISGAKDVDITGLPGVIMGDDGTYTATVDYGWQGVVMPVKEGYEFKPESKPYTSVIRDMTNENYVASKQQFTISGSTGVSGVQLQVSPAGRRPVTSGQDTMYNLTVEYGWSGTITPKRDGYDFDPPQLELDNVTMSMTNQIFTATLKKMKLTGKVTDEKGEPVPDIYIKAEPDGPTTTTDLNGEYEIEVDYRWAGTLTPERDGYTFRLPNRRYTTVMRDQANQSFTAIVQKYTISDTVLIGNMPVAGVTITAKDEQGRTTDTTTTDAQGRFRVTVPYGWTGELVPTKPGLLFQSTHPYTSVTTNMKNGAPEIITPPPAPTPTTPTPTVPTPTTPTPTPTIPTPTTPTPTPTIPTPTPTTPTIPTPTPTVPTPTTPTPTAPTPTTPTPTVPTTPTPGLGGLINNSFTDDDLIMTVLPALSTQSGKTIIAEETVQGLVSCQLSNVTLETALDIVLAGTSYIWKETPYYILVCAGGVRDIKFPVISETERLRLNYITAQAAVGLLSVAFTDYVKAETGPAGTDTYTVVVTAPPSIKERIIADLRMVDRPRAQVLLDARIVVLEKGDLLNLGVEWGWPTISAGIFGGDNKGRGDAESDFGGDWPWGVQIGYSPDNTFTNALQMTLNLLIENSEASILAKPQVMAQDGKESQIQVMQEEYYMLTPPVEGGNVYAYTRSELATIESGTRLTITPHIGDNNDITLQISVEVSDSIPQGRGSELPVVTRRTSDSNVTVKDGGTVALAGLSESKMRSNKKRVPGLSNLPLVGELFKNSDDDTSSREIAVFITAHLVPQGGQAMSYSPSEPAPTIQAPMNYPTGQGQGQGQSFRDDLRRSLSRPTR